MRQKYLTSVCELWGRKSWSSERRYEANAVQVKLFRNTFVPAIMLVIRWLKKPAIMIMIILPKSENAHLKRERENHPQKIQRQIFTVPYRRLCTDLKIVLSWVWTPSPAPEEMSLELTWAWRSRLSGERSWGKLAGDVRDRWSRCWHRSCAFRDLLELN